MQAQPHSSFLCSRHTCSSSSRQVLSAFLRPAQNARPLSLWLPGPMAQAEQVSPYMHLCGAVFIPYNCFISVDSSRYLFISTVTFWIKIEQCVSCVQPRGWSHGRLVLTSVRVRSFSSLTAKQRNVKREENLSKTAKTMLEYCNKNIKCFL